MAVAPLFALLVLFLSGPRRCAAAAAAASPSSSSPSPRPAPLVPALFVIGDSTADVGTNNYLGTLARADREPYGRDFDTHHPTGRFSNGRIPVDYIGNKGRLCGLLSLFGSATLIVKIDPTPCYIYLCS
jgi:hypothetical protein